jgi:hypothetical protein
MARILLKVGKGTCKEPLLKGKAQYSWPPRDNKKRDQLAMHQWLVSYLKWGKVPAGNPFWRGKLSTVDLLVITKRETCLKCNNGLYLTRSGERCEQGTLTEGKAQYSWPPCANTNTDHLAIHQWPISYSKWGKVPAGNPYWRGRLTTLDLLD